MGNVIKDVTRLQHIRFTNINAVTVWECDETFMTIYNRIREYTLVPLHNLFAIWQLAKSAPPGSFWECGVFMGGVSHMLSHIRPIEMFDTFEGIPAKSENDSHNIGDFAADEEAVKRLVPRGTTHKGIIPTKFFDDDIAFCHSDVDQELATWDVLMWVYPRLVKHGILVIDDYAWPHCYGCGKSVHDFFEDKPETPFSTSSGQAIVIKR